MTETPRAATQSFKSHQPGEQHESGPLISTITEALLEKKARDIVLLDVRNLTTLTDFFIICHGTSDTHIQALTRHVLDQAREKLGEKVWKQEGVEARRWVILDYVDVVIHIFNEEKRHYYGIERMWNDAERTEIKDPSA